MKKINDIKAKLAEIELAKLMVVRAKAVLAEAEDQLHDVSWQLFAKAREIINNIVDHACCCEVNSIEWISREKVHVEYTYCCGDNEGLDAVDFPPKYFFMSESEYTADAESQKPAVEHTKKKAKKDIEEYKQYLKLKEKYEDKK